MDQQYSATLPFDQYVNYADDFYEEKVSGGQQHLNKDLENRFQKVQKSLVIQKAIHTKHQAEQLCKKRTRNAKRDSITDSHSSLVTFQENPDSWQQLMTNIIGNPQVSVDQESTPYTQYESLISKTPYESQIVKTEPDLKLPQISSYQNLKKIDSLYNQVNLSNVKIKNAGNFTKNFPVETKPRELPQFITSFHSGIYQGIKEKAISVFDYNRFSDPHLRQFNLRKNVIVQTKQVPRERGFYFPKGVLIHKPKAFSKEFEVVERLYDKNYSFHSRRAGQGRSPASKSKGLTKNPLNTSSADDLAVNQNSSNNRLTKSIESQSRLVQEKSENSESMQFIF